MQRNPYIILFLIIYILYHDNGREEVPIPGDGVASPPGSPHCAPREDVND
jgi:hypothetical protein